MIPKYWKTIVLMVAGMYMLTRGVEVLFEGLKRESFPLIIAISIPSLMLIVSMAWTIIKIGYSENKIVNDIEKYLQVLLMIYLGCLLFLIISHNPLADLLWYFTASSICISSSYMQYRLRKDAPPAFNKLG